MNRSEKIIKNTVAYTIGNFGTKILSYVMVLVYTHFISTDDLGYYDLIITTISLLHPVVLLMIDDGIYRWMVDPNQKFKKEIVSVGIKLVNITSIVVILAFCILNIFVYVPYALLIVLFFYSSIIYQIMLNAVRGLGNSRLYAASGILNSFLLLTVEVIGIVVLNFGVEVLLIAAVFSNIVAIVFLISKQNELRGLLKIKFNKTLCIEMLRYSVPLIPNNICWWIVNSSDRYIILFFLGASYNGIYAVSNKFPTVITTISSIFFLSLQESLINEYGAPDRDSFYSNVFRRYYCLLLGLVLCGIPTTRIVIQLFVNAEYKNAWMYTGILYLGAAFSALSSFLGIGYQISKETKRSIFSTVGSAFINLFVNVIMIQKIGLYAASISTLIAYIVLFVVRIIHSKKYFCLKINYVEFVSLSIVCMIMIVGTYYIDCILVLGLFSILSVCMFIVLNSYIVIKLLKKILR